MADEVAKTVAEEAAEQPYDAANPEQVNQARKRAGRNRKARLEVVKAIMGTVQGRAWFYDQLASCHLFHTPYMHGDPHATSFRCGEHNVGLRLLADIMAAAPDEYVLMVREAKNNA